MVIKLIQKVKEVTLIDKNVTNEYTEYKTIIRYRIYDYLVFIIFGHVFEIRLLKKYYLVYAVNDDRLFIGNPHAEIYSISPTFIRKDEAERFLTYVLNHKEYFIHEGLVVYKIWSVSIHDYIKDTTLHYQERFAMPSIPKYIYNRLYGKGMQQYCYSWPQIKELLNLWMDSH